MIEVYAKSKRNGRWEKVLNGPFPITPEEFENARRRFWEIFNAADKKSQLMDCWVTTAREVLKEYCPALDDFDMLMLGNAIALKFSKVETLL